MVKSISGASIQDKISKCDKSANNHREVIPSGNEGNHRGGADDRTVTTLSPRI